MRLHFLQLPSQRVDILQYHKNIIQDKNANHLGTALSGDTFAEAHQQEWPTFVSALLMANSWNVLFKSLLTCQSS
jgi:hypothetical protein